MMRKDVRIKIIEQKNSGLSLQSSIKEIKNLFNYYTEIYSQKIP